MRRLAYEDFRDLSVGEFPYDYFATGEYHYLPPPGYRGNWYESTTKYTWRPNGAWVVIEDEGRHRLLQTLEAARPVIRMIVTGSTDWTDYTCRVRVQPLKDDGFVGVLLRYQTSRRTYRVGFEGAKGLVLYRDNHEQQDVIASHPVAYSCDVIYELAVTVAGDRITVSLDGQSVIDVRDGAYPTGKVGLAAHAPAFYDVLEVTADEPVAAAIVHTRSKRQRELDELREQYPKPRLWKRIQTRGFGAARNVRWGHLKGDGQLQAILGQRVPFLPTPGDGNMEGVRCLTAIDLDGNVMWQWGEPAPGLKASQLTCDLPIQVYDIDGDGRDEVLCMRNFRFYILDGATGKPKHVYDLPKPVQEEGQFGRLLGDSIIIANFRGLPQARDIVIKNRYKQVWAMDDKLNLLWTHRFRCTGHFACPYDFDGDGRDDLIIGYARISADGQVLWNKEWTDHTDEIVIGPFDPDRDDVQIGLVCGDEGFNVLAPDGTVLHRDMLGHAQRLSAAKYRDDLPGLQYYVVTFWGHPGIISLHDCKGRKQFEFQPTATGNVLNPVNWTGTGVELALLSGSRQHGGMIDGHGRTVVTFPDDGHPELCSESIDLTGDARDEIVLWDTDSIWIYTQDQPFEGSRIYAPKRFPHRNASNYRGEISLPSWQDVPR